MSTKTTTFCDIKNCGQEADHKEKRVSVHFTTETTEGRSVEPYISGESLDFCKEHYQEYINRLCLIGSGAQGYNDYYFVDGNNE